MPKNKKMETAWCSFKKTEVERKTSTNLKTGLNPKTTKKRLEKNGLNRFKKGREITLLKKIINQFKNPLVLILLLAGIATLFLQEYMDSLVIFIALFINIVIGTFQEERASKAFEKLSSSQEKYATVIRSGKKSIIHSEELVVGDVVEIETGSYVPVDIRLIEIKNLTINESALTGEWVDVQKQSKKCSASSPITSQYDMAWMGTLVTSGMGTGIVVETGKDTQVGKIAKSLTGIKSKKTPIQKNIANIAKFLIYIIVLALVLIFVLGIWRGEPFSEMLLIAIAVAVAAMPQGLPAAVTTTLAIGMEKMLKKGGLVRNLLAAETLGATTLILTDKTGTLTKAQMSFKDAISLNSIEKENENDELKAGLGDDEKYLLKNAVLASDAFMEKKNDKWEAQGKSTEKAIIQKGFELGITKEHYKEEDFRIDFLPFNTERGFAASLDKREKGNIIYLSGIPEYLLEISGYVLKNGKEVKIDSKVRELFKEAQKKQSAKGMRLIGSAYLKTDWEKLSDEGKEYDKEILNEKIVFLGFISFEDPVREDVAEAIKKAEEAGSRVVMVTGDNPATASKIAVEAGIVDSDLNVETLTGSDIKTLNDEELYQKIKTVSVFARVLPEQKLRIARILKGKEEVIAMTGDGVNDAPALRSANIGIAVGSGTEVAKEASDMVLINNSFSIIIDAIEEGRRIMDNLKKIVVYLLSTSFSEIILIAATLVFALPLPLLPTQILWANIIEEGLMNFAYAFEKKEEGIMKRNPRSERVKEVLTPTLKKAIVMLSVITGIFLFAIFSFAYFFLKLPMEEIRTIMFVALSIDSIFFAFSLKDLNIPVWKIKLTDNKYLLFSFFLSIILLILAVTLPPLQTLLSLSALSLFDFILLLSAGIVDLTAIEIIKYYLFIKRE